MSSVHEFSSLVQFNGSVLEFSSPVQFRGSVKEFSSRFQFMSSVHEFSSFKNSAKTYILVRSSVQVLVIIMFSHFLRKHIVIAQFIIILWYLMISESTKGTEFKFSGLVEGL